MKIKEFSYSDFENLCLSECDNTIVKNLIQTLNRDTLGNKVAGALGQRQQGHFNKAVLSITEVNRDQVLAIREIQSVLDKICGQNKTEIVFENYRQTFPFQIGLTNGDQVLELIGKIKESFDGNYPSVVARLHEGEKQLDLLYEEFTFLSERMKDKNQDELDKLLKEISDISDEIMSTKKLFINKIVALLERSKLTIGRDDLMILIKNLYLILTSSIETLDAKNVKF